MKSWQNLINTSLQLEQHEKIWGSVCRSYALVIISDLLLVAIVRKHRVYLTKEEIKRGSRGLELSPPYKCRHTTMRHSNIKVTRGDMLLFFDDYSENVRSTALYTRERLKLSVRVFEFFSLKI